MEIWVDKETGVTYVFHSCGNAGVVTPLLDREGDPMWLKQRYQKYPEAKKCNTLEF